MHEVLAVRDRSVERAAASGAALHAARVVMMHFLVDRDGDGDSAANRE